MFWILGIIIGLALLPKAIEVACEIVMAFVTFLGVFVDLFYYAFGIRRDP